MEGFTEMELHKAIKRMRLDRGLTQARLADAVGVSTFTLIRWERGERAPDGRFLEKLAAALSLRIGKINIDILIHFLIFKKHKT